jgi:cyclic pyranopterin phosphate synthase
VSDEVIPQPVALRRRAVASSTPVDTTSVSAMPMDGALVDRFGRVHDDLRISVTDRCNLRCVYCLPDLDVDFLPVAEILTFDEIERVARVARAMGVRSVRLTGGEPLLRRHLVDLVGRLSSLGFDDLALTTNGTHLSRWAQDLADAGLRRVNISCDSLRAERFESIRRRGHLDDVFRALDAAERAGLTPVKINVVVIAGVNDDEVLDFCSFARERGHTVRFIEFMPLDAAGNWDRAQVVATDDLLERISAEWPLEPVVTNQVDQAPAERFRFLDGRGEVGFVASVTRPFCGTCNRLRLTADGAIRNCLFSDNELSVRSLMRSNGTDEDIALVLRRAVWGKLPGHGINDPGFLRPTRSMSQIGG